jgi:hypothetical protein
MSNHQEPSHSHTRPISKPAVPSPLLEPTKTCQFSLPRITTSPAVESLQQLTISFKITAAPSTNEKLTFHFITPQLIGNLPQHGTNEVLFLTVNDMVATMQQLKGEIEDKSSTDLSFGETFNHQPASSLSTEPLTPECTSRQQKTLGSLQADPSTEGSTSRELSTAENLPISPPTLESASHGRSTTNSPSGGCQSAENSAIEAKFPRPVSKRTFEEVNNSITHVDDTGKTRISISRQLH